MGLFDLFRREKREEELASVMNDDTVSDALLMALVGHDGIDRAMGIPAIAACVNRIADTVASLDIKLYKRDGERIEELEGDGRTSLLNDDTGDTLDGTQFKKAMVTDMFLEKGGYAYVHRNAGRVVSLHYVDSKRISFQQGADPIFKDYRVLVNGRAYEGFEWIKLLRNTANGYYGKSIIRESELLLNTVYASLKYEQNLVKTGGNKKGFILSTARLTKEAMTKLKEAFRRLYSNNSENVVVLNDGLTFQESSNTSVELQLNENKKTNSDEICKAFLIPPSIINGGATEEDKKLYYEGCILPILERFCTAINRVLLTEDEKKSLFFAFDTTDLIKSDIEKRFRAYEIACKNGFMQVDEVRRREKLPAFGLDFIKLGLQDVIYYPDRNEIYTPNTNKLSKMGVDESVAEPETAINPKTEGQQDDPDEMGQKGGESEDES